MCSNGRSYCGRDSICIKGNQCLPLDSVRVCSNGSDYCGAGAMCTNENRCLSLSSASVCRNGKSYCSTDSICIEGNKCLPLSSERVCRDGRSHCGEGFRCDDENQCISTAVVEETPPDTGAAQPGNDEDSNLEDQPSPKVDDAPNPFSQFKKAEAGTGCRQGANSSSNITGGSSSGPSTPCAPKPNPFTSVKLVAVNAPVTNPFSTAKEGSPDPSPPCDGSTIPCVSIPGWSGEERYNHSPEKVSVYLANGAVVEIPGARNGEKWGLWMDPDGSFLAKPWSEGARFYSGIGDADGCVPIRGTGFPSPKCELKRQNDWRESQERQARAEAITPTACVRAGGKVVDPNEGTISESDCKSLGGHALFAFGDSSMPPNSRSCVKAGATKPLGRVRDPMAPTEVCRVTERGAVRDRPLDLNNPFDEVLRNIDLSGRLK
jgi:hypothetical protein